MKSIDLKLGNVKLSLENFSLNHMEEKSVTLRQEIFENHPVMFAGNVTL